MDIAALWHAVQKTRHDIYACAYAIADHVYRAMRGKYPPFTPPAFNIETDKRLGREAAKYASEDPSSGDVACPRTSKGRQARPVVTRNIPPH